MQIGLKMEAGDCPTLNMNAMENYLLSHSLRLLWLPTSYRRWHALKLWLSGQLGDLWRTTLKLNYPFSFRNIHFINCINSRRARVRFWLWIMKVTGPTKTLHILNAEVVLIYLKCMFTSRHTESDA